MNPDLDDAPVPIRQKLAAAWTSLLLLYVYVDLLGLYLPGVVEDILAGVVWEFDITQVWATGALSLMAIPILMIPLCLVLPARASRITNLAIASVYVVVSVGNLFGESWVYFFGLAVVLEILVLVVIVRLAWTWPRAATSTPDDRDLASHAA